MATNFNTTHFGRNTSSGNRKYVHKYCTCARTQTYLRFTRKTKIMTEGQQFSADKADIAKKLQRKHLPKGDLFRSLCLADNESFRKTFKIAAYSIGKRKKRGNSR